MLQLKQLPSLNFGSRDGAPVSMLVLHYTDMKTAQDALDHLIDPQTQVSAHYLVDEDGTIYQLVNEENTAWHAGISFWRGNKNVNNISIGIEIANPGHQFGYRPFPPIQMQSVSELCKGIIARHHINKVNVVGHSDIAPQRKMDPGELFNWKWLSEQGIGLWPPPQSTTCNLQPETALTELGYEPPQNDEHLSKIITAFQRHYRPSGITGKWDNECNQILAGLLKMI